MDSKKVLFITTLILIIILAFYFVSTGNIINRGKAVVINIGSRLLIKSNETPTPPPPEQPGGGGGRAPPKEIPKITDFTVEPTFIKVILKQGASKREVIKITNIGDISLNMELIGTSLKKFITLSEDSFSLNPGDSKIINIDVFAGEKEVPDIYIGRILVQGGGLTKIVNVIVQVEEITPFFSIVTKVIEKRIRAPDDVGANIHIVKTDVIEPTQISLYYALRDFDGDVITFKEDSLNMYYEANVVKKLRMPGGYPCVEYIFYTKASFEDRTAASADIFTTLCEKTEMPAPKFNWQPFILIFIIILVCIIIILISIREYRKLKKFRSELEEAPEPSEEDKISNQEKDLCKKCGAELKEKKNYCTKCGTKHK